MTRWLDENRKKKGTATYVHLPNEVLPTTQDVITTFIRRTHTAHSYNDVSKLSNVHFLLNKNIE